MKVVLDTNVVVSGLLSWNGNPARVLNLALSGSIEVCHDPRILAEYAEVLARARFKFDPKHVADVLTKLTRDGIAVDSSEYGGFGLPDPDDEPFLGVVLAGRADFLVTGNIAHFPPAKRRGASVVSPAEFMAHWEKIRSRAGE
jgi:uncharacterized protein